MPKRQLKRQLNLLQIIMLGTAGTIGAQIFVLTGHAASLAGPATVLALLIGGLASYSIAVNYCEMATMFPYAGGAMTYVREAFGNNFLSFLVGSFDCLSSTFYAGLSATGFAYSLRIFFPALPILPTALSILLFFMFLNVLGVTQISNVQIVLGAILLVAFAIFIGAGFALPAGFSLQTFAPQNRFFIYPTAGENITKIMQTIALVYVAFIGFEVIADDAEEISNPSKTIPKGILISLTLVILINIGAVAVSLGTISWPDLAGSETVMTDVVGKFLPAFGVPMMAFAGIVATITSINSSMLSATREAFTLSRDGTWPAVLSRLSRFRTPYVAIFFVALASGFVTTLGEVDFLSYISSAGYLIVLFFASLAMIRLRQKFPQIQRPYKAAFFPLTPILAMATCVLIIAFTSREAMIFGGLLIFVCGIYYFVFHIGFKKRGGHLFQRILVEDRILVPVANPASAENLVHLAAVLAEASENTQICILTIIPTTLQLSHEATERMIARLKTSRKKLLEQIGIYAQERNVPLFTKMKASHSITAGILSEIYNHNRVKFVLMGWPKVSVTKGNVVKEILLHANTNVLVLSSHKTETIRRILVPVGGNPHSRLAIRVAFEISEKTNSQIVFLHVLVAQPEEIDIEDRLASLQEMVIEELGFIPHQSVVRVAQATTLLEGITVETANRPVQLIVLGASDHWADQENLVGPVADQLVKVSTCPVLWVRRHQTTMVRWIRRQIQHMEEE
ncbi:MAG: amino acid permease [Anaerolineaceae bacterium]